jgi:hypothetical protein
MKNVNVAAKKNFSPHWYLLAEKEEPGKERHGEPSFLKQFKILKFAIHYI